MVIANIRDKAPMNLKIRIHNLTLFLSLVLWHGTPVYLWPRAWREVQADHKAQVRKAIWELKKEGKIYQDKEGYLWSKETEP